MGILSGIFGKRTVNQAVSDVNKIDLMKNRVDLVKKISLEKNISENQKSRVALVLDYSYSMDYLYDNGFVQELVERLLPLGIRFDDNEAIDVFLFHNEAYDLGEVTPSSFEGYVKKATKKYSMGGTKYAPVIKMITDKYVSEPGDVAYVMFITDGDNSDKKESTKAIKKASKHGIFWQFIGIGTASFDYLEKLDNMDGRFIDNANFFQVKDLKSISDEQLYSDMMNEYPQYLVEAKQKGIKL